MHAPERWPYGEIESWWAWRDHLDRVQDPNTRDVEARGRLRARAAGGGTQLLRNFAVCGQRQGFESLSRPQPGTTPVSALSTAWSSASRIIGAQ